MTDNTSHPGDVNAIAGSAIGAKTEEEHKQSSFFSDGEVTVDPSKSLKSLGTEVYNSIKTSLSSFTDSVKEPKYRSGTGSFFANGSLSILPSVGKLIFAKDTNDSNNGAFKIDQDGGQMYSSSKETVLGSLDITTVDGYKLNQSSTTFPSTSYSPTKPWVKNLFPVLSNRNLIQVAILEAVQVLIQRALEDSQSTETRARKDDIDIATLIVDNQEIEDRILSNNGAFN